MAKSITLTAAEVTKLVRMYQAEKKSLQAQITALSSISKEIDSLINRFSGKGKIKAAAAKPARATSGKKRGRPALKKAAKPAGRKPAGAKGPRTGSFADKLISVLKNSGKMMTSAELAEKMKDGRDMKKLKAYLNLQIVSLKKKGALTREKVAKKYYYGVPGAKLEKPTAASVAAAKKTGRKPATKKAATRGPKAAAKKTVVRKSTAKKTAVKKVAAKKVGRPATKSAQKTTAKVAKPAAKKVVAKKAAVKAKAKPAAKKVVAKKAAPKAKPVAKKAAPGSQTESAATMANADNATPNN